MHPFDIAKLMTAFKFNLATYIMPNENLVETRLMTIITGPSLHRFFGNSPAHIRRL